MKVRLAALMLCALALASCGEKPPPTGPSIRLQDVADRLVTYTLRIEDEALTRDASTQHTPMVDSDIPLRAVTTYPSPPAPDCPGVGSIAKTEFSIGDTNPATQYGLLRTWLTANRFRVTEQTVDGQPTLDGRTSDGFTAAITMIEDDVQVVLTSPCGWPADVPGGPAQTGTSKPAQKVGPPELACQKPAEYVVSLSGPQYRGPGSHLIAVATSLPDTTAATTIFPPSGWGAERGTSGDLDRRRVQLVACVTGTATAGSRPVSCKYDRPQPKTLTLGVREAKYDVVVRTARTGQQVGRFSVRGTQSDQDSCPSTLIDNTTELLRGIDLEAFEAKLRPFVTTRK
ncbi:hypothetical protein OG474_21735 [Kribbella sp. NBC_01505]|uniref:hypothetical protein n=1 Tax=Kribbella sp. NBC_01505 TaxID=2903580 RepID=UPI00386C31FA